MEWKTVRFERRRRCPVKALPAGKHDHPDKNPINTRQLDLLGVDSKNRQKDFMPLAINSTSRYEQRYYILKLEKDLLGDWRIVRINGQIGSRLGSTRYECVKNYQQGLLRFNALCQYREKVRHYTVVTDSV